MTPQFRCRSCGDADTVPVLSLGNTALANALVGETRFGELEPAYPLDVVFCSGCSLVQITETVAPELLFRDYVYFSSYSDTMFEHARDLAERQIRERRLGAESLVVEIASNDGYLLRNYRDRGVPVLGVEPARNVAAVAEGRGIPTVAEFFGGDLARQLREQGRAADVIHAHNVLAHVADLNGFVGGIETLLKPGGVAVIEVPSVRDLIDGCEFDTIYHEHLCYFSLTALEQLFRRHGMRAVDVCHVPIHGGSLQVTVGRAGEAEPGERVFAMLRDEEAAGLTGQGYYAEFADRVAALRSSLLELLEGVKAKGQRVAAYGASAKGSTLLNFCGIGRETIDFVVDRSTVKQGKFTPGTQLPILPTEELLHSMPDYTLLLAWNFADEILEQQAEYRRRGGKFIVPVPEARVV